MTALVTDGSYMRPLLDELVFTAANQVDAPTIALEFLRQSGQPTQGTAETFQRLSKTEPPMTVEVVELGKGAPLERLAQGGAQPLFYACLVTAFLASAVPPPCWIPPGASRPCASWRCWAAAGWGPPWEVRRGSYC